MPLTEFDLLAVAVKVWPSAHSSIARARLARATGVFYLCSQPVQIARAWYR